MQVANDLLVLTVTLHKKTNDKTKYFHRDDKPVCQDLYMFIPVPVFDTLVKPLIYCHRQLQFIIIIHVYYAALEFFFK